MSAPVKKVAETVAKAAATSAKTVIPPASRAVTAKEAASIAPNTVSSTETSMPWNGWFDSFLADKLSKSTYEKLRSIALFMPNDIHGLGQQPIPEQEVPITEDGKVTAKFRYPSPGSQPKVRQPKEEAGTMHEDPFVISHYTRDTTHRYSDPAYPNAAVEEIKLALLPEDDPRVEEAKKKFEEGPLSSPGNKGMFATGKSDFDPTGLRATMSANHEALEKSLDENMPDHLPTPTWWENQEELAAWYIEKNLPVPLGNPQFGTVPREGRIARW
jgi:hypothetical protein